MGIISALAARKGSDPAVQLPISKPSAPLPTVEPWSPPTVTVRASYADSWPFRGEKSDEYREAPHGWWVLHTLNTETGDLFAEANDRMRPTWPDLSRSGGHVGLGLGWRSSAHLLYFPVERKHSHERVTHDQELLAELAQRFLLALRPVPGTDVWDWSREAAILHKLMGRVVRSYDRLTRDDLAEEEARYAEDFADTITLEEMLSLYPELPASGKPLATMSNATLDALAAGLSKNAMPPAPPEGLIPDGDEETRQKAHEEWNGRLRGPGGRRSWYSPRLVGARADFYELRARLAEEMTGWPYADATEFLAARPALLAEYVSAGLPDEDLARVVDELTARVAQDECRTLVGVEDCLRAQRARLRDQVRATLGQVGAEARQVEDETRERVKAIEAEAAERIREVGSEARKRSAACAALLTEVLAWHDPADYDKDGVLRTAALAQSASVPVERVERLVERLAEEYRAMLREDS